MARAGSPRRNQFSNLGPFPVSQVQGQLARGSFVPAGIATDLPTPDGPERLSTTPGTIQFPWHALIFTSRVARMGPCPMLLQVYLGVLEKHYVLHLVLESRF